MISLHPLLLTKVILKIDIIQKDLSHVDEHILLWFTELLELNLQKQNLNLLIQSTSIRLYLCYPHNKVGKKYKT